MTLTSHYLLCKEIRIQISRQKFVPTIALRPQIRRMRFRCRTTDSDRIQDLLRALQTFCRFAHSFYVRLSATEVQLITDRIHSSSPFMVKCDLKCEDFFDDYDFRGMSSENNLIYFQIKSEGCTQVLSSLSTAIKSLTLKLAKAKSPSVGCVLSIAVELPSYDSDRLVWHQIKVDIVRAEYWDEIGHQNFTDFDLSLLLSDARALIGTTERLAHFSQYLDLAAKRTEPSKALITIIVQSDSINIKNQLTNLELNSGHDSRSDNTFDGWVRVRVDIRKINVLFNTLKQLKPNAVVCDISNRTRIHFQFSHNSINFEAVVANIER